MENRNKKEITIKKLNEKIDDLIINGKTNTKQFKKLMRMHKILVKG